MNDELRRRLLIKGLTQMPFEGLLRAYFWGKENDFLLDGDIGEGAEC